MHTNRSFDFVYKKDAEAVFDQAKEIAEMYGYVTVADICDLAGVASIYAENLYGLSPTAIKKAKIYLNKDCYVLYLPQCDWKKDGYAKETEDMETPSTGEPINITISSNEWNTRRNDIEQVFNELFRNSDKIKDRPVFISLM